MKYQVLHTPQAEREFLSLPKVVQKRIARWYELLSQDPRRAGTKQLEGHVELRRVHASKDYVILYQVRNAELIVLVVRVAHRRDVYRRL